LKLRTNYDEELERNDPWIGISDDSEIIKDRGWWGFDVFAENTETACTGLSAVADWIKKFGIIW
jgi:hypothetical protein